MSLRSESIRDKAKELDELITQAIDQDDWNPSFRSALWEARINNIETMKLLDNR